MKIAIVTLGTRGDVQPYVAVGRALAERGHEVWIATHDEYRDFVLEHGLGHRTLRGSFREICTSEAGRAWLASADSVLEYGRRAKEIFLPMQQGWCEDADAAVEGADAVAFYVIAAHAYHAAERRRLPMAALSPFPIVPNREVVPFPSPLLDRAPGFLKLAATRLMLRAAFGSISGVHRQYRTSVGLAPFREPELVSMLLAAGVPVLHLISPHVLPRPRDWDPQHRMVGHAFLEEPHFEPSAELARFVERPAVYIGFGSMTGYEPERLAGIVRGAVRQASVRAVVSRGWAELAPASEGELLVVDEVPHDWLFPRVSAVVHHGGAGTLAAGLRAGKPTVVAPFFGDQPFWGWLNQRIGTGPAPVPRKTLTAESLAAAILEAPRYRARAAALGEAIRKEDGARATALALEQHFRR